MADIADLGAETAEFFLSLAEKERKKPQGPPFTGKCLNCGEDTDEQRRWCDADCRDDWQRGQQ